MSADMPPRSNPSSTMENRGTWAKHWVTTPSFTSYGILRRDISALETLNFSVAVFDEIQNLKNPNPFFK